MIRLLFTMLSAEVAVVVLLLIHTPLRKLVLLGLDRLKRGLAPLMVKTVAITVLIVLVSSLHSVRKIQGRSTATGVPTPSDQVLLIRHLLEASLMGYSLFLLLIIVRLHHYIRELRGMKKSMEAMKKQNRTLEEGEGVFSEKIKAKDRERTNLKAKIAELEFELEAKTAEVKTAEANALALSKQSEGFLLEYDLLLEDNQNLQSQLQSIDCKLSHSDGKKFS